MLNLEKSVTGCLLTNYHRTLAKANVLCSAIVKKRWGKTKYLHQKLMAHLLKGKEKQMFLVYLLMNT